MFSLCASSPLMGIGGSIPLLKGNPSHIPLASELQLPRGKCVLEERVKVQITKVSEWSLVDHPLTPSAKTNTLFFW